MCGDAGALSNTLRDTLSRQYRRSTDCFFGCIGPIQPDHQLIAVARDDDTTFGILHSRFPELWTLRMCTWLGVGNDPRYTPSTTFETFPFPEGLTPNFPAANYADDARAIAIAAAAKRLDELRGNWLNPPDLIKRVPELVPGVPRPRFARRRQGSGCTEKADADQSLQSAPALASRCSSCARRGGRRRLRLAGGPVRRRGP